VDRTVFDMLGQRSYVGFQRYASLRLALAMIARKVARAGLTRWLHPGHHLLYLESIQSENHCHATDVVNPPRRD
jgi:hypothetical protein